MATGGWRLSIGAGATISREMGYSRDEFAGVLPKAMRDWAVSGGPDAWQISTVTGAAIATIGIRSLPDREMGSLRLPVLAVSIHLDKAGEGLAAEFMHRFERGFHRGGG